MDASKNNAQFGLWLKEHRREFDLTQEELAMQVDCSWETIRKIEAGVRRPSKQVAELLADFFRVPLEERPAFVQFARSGSGGSRAALAQQMQLDASDQQPINNLPGERTTFVGRESALAAVCDLLLRDEVRLVTLFGPPGIGKTRLSLKVAARLLANDDPGAEPVFRDGIFFIPLAAVNDPSTVILTIMQSLGVKEMPSLTLAEHLVAYLRERQMLLVLDNFEQVVQARDIVADLLVECPCLKVLATSREVLRVYGEHKFPVRPMSLPNRAILPVPEVLKCYEGIQLFVERARAVQPGFTLTKENAPAIAEICARLDALPLAIELAATRANILSPQAILARLGHRLALLTTGARDLPARQQTLRDAIAWSYDLLDPDEQALFRGLSVFVDGCTLEAAEVVAGNHASPILMLDRLTSLADKSLLVQEEGVDGEPRLAMLETIREYALERLEEMGETQTISQAHAAYFSALTEKAEPYLISAERQPWLQRLAVELNNLRAALAWSLDNSQEVAIALRMASSLHWFWYFRGYLTEGRTWVEKALAASGTLRHTIAGAKTLTVAGRLALLQDDYTAMRAYLEESVVNWRELANDEGLAYALTSLGIARAYHDRDPEGSSLLREAVSLFRNARDQWGLAFALNLLGDAVGLLGEREEELARYKEESLALYRQLGDQWGIGYLLSELGHSAVRQGNYHVARAYLEEALSLEEALDDKWIIAHAVRSLGDVALYQGDYAHARTHYERSHTLYSELADNARASNSLRNLGHLAQLEGDFEQAASLYRQSMSIVYRLRHIPNIALCLIGLAGIDFAIGRFERGATLLGAADALRSSSHGVLPPADRAIYEKTLSALQSVLDGPTLEEAMAEGRMFDLARAFMYAAATGGNSPKPITSRC